jgi:hypothetical protein
MENINSPLSNVEVHIHNGIDSLRVHERDIEGAIDENTAVLLTGNQTIAGVKTFTSIPVLPASDPTTDNQAVRKAYVDTIGNLEVIVSDTVKDSANTIRDFTTTAYSKTKEIAYNEIDGNIRVYFEIYANGYAKIYKNGNAVGTERQGNGSWVGYSQDFATVTGDLWQLYTKRDPSGGTAVRSFQLRYDKLIKITAGTINTD